MLLLEFAIHATGAQRGRQAFLKSGSLHCADRGALNALRLVPRLPWLRGFPKCKADELSSNPRTTSEEVVGT